LPSRRRPNGEGSIYRRSSDGLWVGSLTITDPGAPRKRRPVYGKSRPEVQRKLATLRRQYLETGTLPNANLTVAAWMTTWLDDIAGERLRPSTMTSHRQKVRLYINPLIGKHRLDKLTPDHIRGMYREMADRGLSMNTRRQTHAILSRALTVAVREGKVARNPAQMMDGPPPETAEIDALNATEIAALIEAMVGDRMESRWLAALHLGLRQGEALGLGWDQVDLEDGTLSVVRSLGRVPGKGLVMGPPKSKKSVRTVPLTAPLAASLARRREAWEAERQEPGHVDLGLVWGQPSGRAMDPRRDWQAWKELLARAEVRDVRLHDARHAAATALGALGVPPQVMSQILGHAQITTTMLYTHTDLTAMREAIGRLDRKALG
jgi:integrase